MVKVAAAALIALGALAPLAHGDRVLERRSMWSGGRRRIMTDVVVERTDGTIEHRRVPGGVVDGIGMVEWSLGPAGDTSTGGALLGWVPSRSTAGKPIAWDSSCVYVATSLGSPSDIEPGRVPIVLDAAIAEWTAKTRACGYLAMQRALPSTLEVGLDGTNLLAFREDRWCRPTDACDEDDCHPPDAAAVTTVFFIDRPGQPDDGVILDADIEVNAVDFAIWDQGATTGTGTGADLQNTLTHELGHLIGLGHTCWDEEGEPDLDGDNQPIPRCGSNPPAILEATMYNYQDSGPPPETIKTTVEADDVEGLCGRYPIAADPMICKRSEIAPQLVGGSGCSRCAVAGRDLAVGPLGLLVLLGLGLAGARRRA